MILRYSNYYLIDNNTSLFQLSRNLSDVKKNSPPPPGAGPQMAILGQRGLLYHYFWVHLPPQRGDAVTVASWKLTRVRKGEQRESPCVEAKPGQDREGTSWPCMPQKFTGPRVTTVSPAGPLRASHGQAAGRLWILCHRWPRRP